MIKLDWGKGIFYTIIIFLIVVVGTVLFTFTVDVNLVADDYYEREIKYQEHIDRVERTKSLPKNISIIATSSNIIVKYPEMFPAESISGEIHLYRPADQNSDLAFFVLPDSTNTQHIETGIMHKGMWKIKIDWQVEGVEYFTEKILMVN